MYDFYISNTYLFRFSLHDLQNLFIIIIIYLLNIGIKQDIVPFKPRYIVWPELQTEIDYSFSFRSWKCSQSKSRMYLNNSKFTYHILYTTCAISSQIIIEMYGSVML